MKMKNLLTRTLVGAAFVAVMVGCTVCSPWTLLMLVVSLTILAVEEFLHICTKGLGLTVNRTLVTSLAIVIPVFTYFVCTDEEPDFSLLLMLYMVEMLVFLVSELFSKKTNHLGNLGLMALTLLYVVMPLSLLIVLALGPQSAQTKGEPYWLLPLATYVFLWINDSGAYITGSLLGRHKLAPRISPGKTWEGSIGGAVLTLAVGVLMWRLVPAYALWQWLGMALVTVVMGTLGDLTESLFKRQLGLKDSGKLLPGHGGILDRIDSMLFAVPAVLVFLACIA